VGHTQETLADALQVDRTTIGRWESGRGTPQPWIRPKLARALRISIDTLEAFLAAPPQGSPPMPREEGRRSPGLAPTAKDRLIAPLGESVMAAVAADAAESTLFLRFASGCNVDDILLEQIDADITRLATDYVSRPVSELVHDISTVRRTVFDLLRGRQQPHQTSHLYLAAGRLSGLATHVALDLGQYLAAATHARTAWRCAESAGHNGLRA